MRHFLIGKDLPYAAKRGTRTSTANPVNTAAATPAANPEELANGAIGIFTPDGTLITGIAVAAGVGLGAYTSLAFVKNLATALADQKGFVIAQGTDLGPILTPVLSRNVVHHTVIETSAPIKQVTTVTPVAALFPQANGTMASTATAFNYGSEVVVRVIDTTSGNNDAEKRTYTYGIQVGDTLATVLTGIADRINAPNSAPNSGSGNGLVVALENGTVLTLTARNFGTNFRIALDTLFIGASIAYTTPFGVGNGQPDQLEEVERVSQAGHQGQFMQAGGRDVLPLGFTSRIDGSLTYDQYVGKVINPYHSTTGATPNGARYIEYVLAMPEANTFGQEQQLTAIFKALYNPESETTTTAGVGEDETGADVAAG